MGSRYVWRDRRAQGVGETGKDPPSTDWLFAIGDTDIVVGTFCKVGRHTASYCAKLWPAGGTARCHDGGPLRCGAGAGTGGCAIR